MVIVGLSELRTIASHSPSSSATRNDSIDPSAPSPDSARIARSRSVWSDAFAEPLRTITRFPG